MSLFIVCLLIWKFEASPWLYVLASGVWLLRLLIGMAVGILTYPGEK